jgi:N-acyl-D-amino-acid deacylase
MSQQLAADAALSKPIALPAKGLSKARLTLGTFFLLSTVMPGFTQQPQQADVLITGGNIYDGSEGMRAYVGDVAIAGDRIVYVGRHANVAAKRVINATGLIVSPGFIDGHTHPDHFLNATDPQLRQVPAWLMQGVSTILIGVDGGGAPEIKTTFDKLTTQGVGVNVASYVGYGTVRRRVIGVDDRAPTPAELETEKELVSQGMCQGALGLSSGLFYFPQSFAKTDEVIALAKEAAKRGGIYDTHERDEGTSSVGVIASTKEVLQIGREAGLPVHISHIKASGADSWGKSGEIIKLIDEARASGQNVTANQYPYPAFQTGLDALLVPRWAMDGGYPALIKRLNDNLTLEKIRDAMRQFLRMQGGAHTVLFTHRGQPWSGKYLDEVAKEWNIEPVDAAIRIIRQTEHQPIVGFGMSQQDIAAFMKQSWTVTGSDGGDGHPRQYGTFPMKYQQFVKQHPIISLPFYIRHQTGLSADIYMLDHRGYLKPGYYADVVVFDPKRFVDKADYVNWDVLSEGVVELFVNGKAAVDNGKMTVALSGRPLPHTPTAGSCM